jgi:hypothetical protein
MTYQKVLQFTLMLYVLGQFQVRPSHALDLDFLRVIGR